MIDAMAAEPASVKFLFKINIQTSELVCHSLSLFKQASSASILHLLCVFSHISTTLRNANIFVVSQRSVASDL